MPGVGVEPTIQLFEKATTFHTLDSELTKQTNTVILTLYLPKYYLHDIKPCSLLREHVELS
jgi:hypothetical protein